jgi:hypothetical protein
MKKNLEVISMSLLKVVGLIIIFVLLTDIYYASEMMTDETLAQAAITKEQASQKFLDFFAKNVTNKSVRINQYPSLLDTGIRVREAYSQGSDAPKYLICEHPSWLFFVDMAPGAHFAHPTKISLLDAVDGNIKSIDAQWWPVIEMPLFNTEFKRNDSSTVVFEK